MADHALIDLSDPLSPGRQTLETEIEKAVVASLRAADQDGLFVSAPNAPQREVPLAGWFISPRYTQFSVDPRYGRDLRLTRAEWVWIVLLRFDAPATPEHWIRRLSYAPLNVPRSELYGHEWHVIKFRDVQIQNPPTAAGSNGTQVLVYLDVSSRRASR